jgi:hypothetical protein
VPINGLTNEAGDWAYPVAAERRSKAGRQYLIIEKEFTAAKLRIEMKPSPDFEAKKQEPANRPGYNLMKKYILFI